MEMRIDWQQQSESSVATSKLFALLCAALFIGSFWIDDDRRFYQVLAASVICAVIFAAKYTVANVAWAKSDA